MSFDPVPEWTDKIEVVTAHTRRENDAQVHNAQVRCPYCERDHKDEVVEHIKEQLEVSYYEAAHVPPQVIITCRQCESDFYVALALTVRVTGVTR